MPVASLRVLLLIGAIMLPVPAPAWAEDPDAWDATWVGGWDTGQGTQLVITGGTVVGFFWRGEYISEFDDSTSLGDGEPIAFSWPNGKAFVKSGPEGELVLAVRERGKPETVLLLRKE